MQDLVDGFDFFIWRGMENNDNGANETYCAAEFAQNTKLFLQEVRTKNSPDEDTQGT